MEKLKTILLKKKNLIYTIPIALIVVLLPLIVRFGIYKTGLDKVIWTYEPEYSTDLYLYCKAVLFNILSSGMLVLMLIDIKHVIHKIKTEKVIWILFAAYAVLVLLSSFMSEYQFFAWHGSVGQFESAWVLLGYIITGLYIFIYCQEKEIAKKLPFFFLISSLIMGVIGIFQFLGKDLFATKFVQSLCIPQHVLEQSGGIQFQFDDNRVYLTLYNPNYAGVYCACLIVIMFSLMLSERRLWLKALYVLSVVSMGICLVGTGSKTGIAITIVVLVLVLILHLRKFLLYWYLAIPGVTAIVLCVLLSYQFNSIDLLQNFLDGVKPEKTEYRLSNLYTDQYGLNFCYDGVQAIVMMEASEQGLGVAGYCADGSEFTITEVTDGSAHFILSHEKLPDIPLSFMNFKDIVCLSVTLDGEEWIITNQLANTYLYLNSSGRWDRIRMPRTAVFTNHPTWLSGRGEIWSKSIPLLKSNIALGSGPDSFVMLYPNNDYLGEHNSGNKSEYTTRPHNWYLQMGIQTGVISLVMVLAAFVFYLIRGTRRCFMNAVEEERNDGHSYLEAFFLGSITFMLMGLINDSSVGVTPLFWCMFGMALAWMKKLPKNDENVKNIE